MAVALNEIDFSRAPFVGGPNGAYYVEPHRCISRVPGFPVPGWSPRAWGSG